MVPAETRDLWDPAGQPEDVYQERLGDVGGRVGG